MPLVDYQQFGAQDILLTLDKYMGFLDTLPAKMIEATDIVYETTRHWHESGGEGTWAPLARATIERKSRAGASDPNRILYEWGNLFRSVTSAHGPYSFRIPMKDGVAFGVNWAPAEFLNAGVEEKGILGHPAMPARPIWPPLHTALGRGMMEKIQLLFRLPTGTTTGKGILPLAPGTRNSARGAGGRFVSRGL